MKADDDKKEQRIPVVWGVDKKYILQAFVVMRSILLHSREKYHFIILTADCIEKEVMEFSEILKEEYSNFKVSVRLINQDDLEGAKIYNGHLSKAAYFRLFIPEMIQEYDKCIYLDCDLIVQGDLRELYETELGDNYLAGVKDCHIIADTPQGLEHQRIIGLPSRDKYINSGVLVMGLRKMRQDEIFSYFKDQMKKENMYEDQDVLNVCCYPHIKILPLKYNLFHFYLGGNIKRLYSLPYDRQDFDFDHNCPYILHMGGIYKGWSYLGIKGSSEWWKIAEMFSAAESYQFYRSKCQDIYKGSGIPNLISRAKAAERIMIWGYSRVGKYLCDLLLEYQLDNIEAFADNNKAVWGETYKGIPVVGFSSDDRENSDILWIISCQVSYAEVIEQLKNKGIKESNIIWYSEMFSESHYLSLQCLLLLNESTYDSMISELAEREYVCKFPDRNDRERYIKDIMNNPMRYSMEYAYLSEKYYFDYWFETWHREGVDNEDNSYHSVSEQ